VEDDEQYVLDDYDSDGERSIKRGNSTDGLSAATLELMEQLGMTSQTPLEDDLETEDETKVRHSSSMLYL
jgi:chromosome transmission fidelity protein 1